MRLGPLWSVGPAQYRLELLLYVTRNMQHESSTGAMSGGAKLATLQFWCPQRFLMRTHWRNRHWARISLWLSQVECATRDKKQTDTTDPRDD